jgi:pyridoxamine 5'-phosphate oxidase
MTAPETLDALRDHIAAKLERAVTDRHAAWRTPICATAGPQARVVVLRGSSDSGRRLEVHTDRRSDKVSALAACPEIELCFWDPRSSEQLRARGTAVIETDGEAVERVWAALPIGSRLPYLSLPAPGEVIAQADVQAASRLTKDETEQGRDVFAVISIQVESWDWLELGSGGQRRARFRFPKPSEEDAVQAEWIAP